jgi:DNA-binding cell septation regulator SpoVG
MYQISYQSVLLNMNIRHAYKESLASGQSATKEITDLRNADESLKMDAKVYPVRKENAKSLAYAKVYLDNAFVINNVSIMEGKNGPFVAMPSYKTKKTDEYGNAEYKDICYPVTKEAREKLHDIVFAEYKKAKDETRTSQTHDKSADNSVPDWIEAADEELPFPGKDEEERAIGYIPVKQEKHEEKRDKPIKVARKGR